ncbi:serine hydrolase FSH [Aspergillus undulatus]|uniref:serine hydrolase FSH n=1 Tax=Aspergillus undulatus TaxID=1810928 RepID=UPI003CCDD1E2
MRATIDNRHTALPRILCLHGGGSNARIFKAQTRALRYELSDHFRFVFVEGPFDSEPGPDVTSAYEKFGPFRRWFRSRPQHPPIDPQEAVACIQESIYAAMDLDDLQGGTGEYVAVMGFSQGAKLAASLLFRQQVRAEKLGQAMSGTNFWFALVMSSALLDASQIALDRPATSEDLRRMEHVLCLPTIHVHGLQDTGLMLHRVLLREYCSKNARLVEWDGGHRVPIKTKDVVPLVHEILQLVKQTGVALPA